MHATFGTPRPTRPDGTEPVLRRRLAASGAPALEVCLWPDEPPPPAAGDGLQADDVWTVFAHHLGRAVGRQPVVAQLVRFCGPRSTAVVAASRRAGTERIWPAVRDLDGLVDVLVLERPGGDELVLSFATSPEHFARAGERIMSTTLLPGEDPALLTGPDRVEVLHVVTSTTPAPA